MHLPHKQSDTITDCAAKLCELTTALLAPLTPSGPALELSTSNDLFSEQPNEQLWLIQEGEAFYRVGAKQVTCLSPGDLLGLERHLTVERGVYGCLGPITLLPYERSNLLAKSPPRVLAEYLMYSAAFFRLALAQEIRAEFQPAAGFMHFQAGETIIHQGADADRVYTLLEGQADAMRDGVKVGEILADEMFGALAVFTHQKRIASVVAASDCTVLAVRKEEFADLVELQPQICLGLVEELAEKIHQLNGHLLAAQAKG